MRNYEVTIIVDPVLSGDEVKSTVEAYIDLIKQHDCEIVHKGEMGLRQLAYSIKKKHSGFYFFTIHWFSKISIKIRHIPQNVS